MNKQQLAAALLRTHQDGMVASTEEGHVYRVWEDGEVTMTKCGSLMGQRREILLEPQLTSNSHVPLELMPGRNTDHGYVFCADESAAQHARSLIEGWLAVWA